MKAVLGDRISTTSSGGSVNFAPPISRSPRTLGRARRKSRGTSDQSASSWESKSSTEHHRPCQEEPMKPTSPAPATARTLEVPGARLYYEVRGAGPLVLLVG